MGTETVENCFDEHNYKVQDTRRALCVIANFHFMRKYDAATDKHSIDYGVSIAYVLRFSREVRE